MVFLISTATAFETRFYRKKKGERKVKKVTSVFLGIIMVLGLASGAFAKEVSLSERELSIGSWECLACNAKILTLTAFGLYLTNRKDKGSPVLPELERYLKDQRNKVKNFFSNSQISSCSNGSTEYNKAHNFDLIDILKFRPDNLRSIKDKLFYIDL